MKISPYVLERIQSDHVAVLKLATTRLQGTLLEQAKNEYQQMKNAPLYLVSPRLTRIAVDEMVLGDNTPQLLLAGSGIMAFSEGTGLMQPCLPPTTPHSTREVEILGLQWFFEVNGALVVNPIFDAAELRRIDPRLMPRKYTSGLFPFVEQRNLSIMMGFSPMLSQAHQLLRTMCALEPDSVITHKTIHVSRSKKETVTVHYNDMDLKQDPATMESVQVAEVRS